MYFGLAFIIPRPQTVNLARCILIIIELFSSSFLGEGVFEFGDKAQFEVHL